jgi:hypothetical protein
LGACAPDREHQHKAVQAHRQAQHIAGEGQRAHPCEACHNIVDGRIAPTNAVGDKLLRPGIKGGFGNGTAQGEAANNQRHINEQHFRAELREHERDEQQTRRDHLTQPEERHPGALIPITGDGRRDQQRDQSTEGKQREQKTDLGVAEVEFTQEEDKCGAEIGQLGKDAVGRVERGIPGQAADFFGVCQYVSHQRNQLSRISNGVIGLL